MAWSLIPVCSGSSEASSGEKTSAKSEYSVGIEVGASFATNAAICALREGCTSPSWLGLSREATWTTKVSCPGSRAAAANSFFPTGLTHLVRGKTSSIVYNLYQSSFFRKSISTLLKVRKGIPRTTFGLTFAIRKIFSKNLTLSAWSVIEKTITTIL